MGNFFGYSKEQKFRVIMCGLDAAGKTTILYRMKLGEVVNTIPTVGFNVESIKVGNVELVSWDIGLRSMGELVLD